jgi:hypothetical protein
MYISSLAKNSIGFSRGLGEGLELRCVSEVY